MEKEKMQDNTSSKSSRMVSYLAAAVALLAVAFIVLIACATYLIENNECEEKTPTAVAPMNEPESCYEFHYDGQIGNTSYTEHTTVCDNTKTEFGIVRDSTTGHVINTFFVDYIQEMKVAYLAASHKCLLTHDLEMDSFDNDLDGYRNNRYMQGPYEYSVGEKVDNWDEIPETMRGFCSPHNTNRWLSGHADDSPDHPRDKRHNTHLCCCYVVYGPYLYISYACGAGSGCSFGSGCHYTWDGHTSSCSNAFNTCYWLFCYYTTYC